MPAYNCSKGLHWLNCCWTRVNCSWNFSDRFNMFEFRLKSVRFKQKVSSSESKSRRSNTGREDEKGADDDKGSISQMQRPTHLLFDASFDGFYLEISFSLWSMQMKRRPSERTTRWQRKQRKSARRKMTLFCRSTNVMFQRSFLSPFPPTATKMTMTTRILRASVRANDGGFDCALMIIDDFLFCSIFLGPFETSMHASPPSPISSTRQK